MMRILYGVQGTGNGHITRARMLGPELESRGIKVDYLFSGRQPKDYFNMEPFGQYRTREGFTFVTENGEVDMKRTVLNAKLGQFIKDVAALKVKEYDLVVTDFEPVTAWAARLKGVKSVGIAHQYAFTHKIPGREHSRFEHLAIPLMTPVNHAIGLHWDSFGKAILPPMISPVSGNLSVSPRKVLVYLPFENLDRVIEFLKPWSSYDFHIFAAVEQSYQEGHIRINPLSRETFHQSMLSCAGILTSAGFGVCSEAIQAGKHLIVKPLAGQFEQAANATALARLNLGDSIDSFDDLAFESWLKKMETSKVAHPWPNTASLLADWIESDCEESLLELRNRAWPHHPSPLSHKRAETAAIKAT